jgi:hypothetical protein
MCSGVLFQPLKKGTPTDTNGHQHREKAAIISHQVTSSHIQSDRALNSELEIGIYEQPETTSDSKFVVRASARTNTRTDYQPHAPAV